MKFSKIKFLIVLLLLLNFDFYLCLKRIKNKVKTASKTNSNPVGKYESCLEDLFDVEKMYKSDLEARFSNEDSINKYLLTHDSLKRLRFIHGKCNPVLIIPGLLATQLNLVLQCHNIRKEDKIYKEIQFYCGKYNGICNDATAPLETYTIWPNLDNGAFAMMLTSSNKFNSCFAYFMTYMNRKDSCKGEDGKEHCRYSDYIKIVPKGIEEGLNDNPDKKKKTSSDFMCGYNAINNILRANNFQDGINDIIGATKGFKLISKSLVNAGYLEGFSYMNLPYDFREAQCNNLELNKIFREAVLRLHQQTGKKVVIIAHSYGNLNTHFQLKEANKDLTSKIAHFISLAPPFTGVNKGDYLMSRGTTEFFKDFKILKVNITKFSQSFAINYLPSIYMLRKFNYLEKLREYYSDSTTLVNAFEKYMKYSTCIQYYGKNSQICNRNDRKELIELFPNELGFMNDEEFCNNNESVAENSITENFENKKKFYNDDNSNIPIPSLCNIPIFDYQNCAAIKNNDKGVNTNYDYSNKQNLILKDLCRFGAHKNEKSKLFYYKKCEAFDEKKCDNEFVMYHSNSPLKFYEEIQYLCSNYHDNENMDGCMINQKIQRNQILNHSTRVNQIGNMCSNSRYKLEHPDVPVTILFNRSIQTRTAFIANQNDIKDQVQTRNESYFASGDGTVEADSSLFVGLKWLFDNKKNGKSTVKLFDYCAPVNSSKMDKYTYNSSKDLTSDKNYFFLNCSCFDYKKGEYKKDVTDCSHANLLNDENVVKLILDIVSSQENPKISKIDTKLILPAYKENKDNRDFCFNLYKKTFYGDFDLNPKPLIETFRSSKKRKFK